MRILLTLVLPVAVAFLLVALGNVYARYRERDLLSYRDRVAKQTEAIMLVGAALIITLAVLLQFGTTSTDARPSSSPPRSPSGELICEPGTLSISGSSALAVLASAVATDYTTKCSQQGVQTTIDVKASSSQQGLSLVEQGKVQIADSDLSALPTQGDLVDHRIAVVVFTIVINSSVTHVTSLTQGQLKGIFGHTITNWSEVGGPDLPITVFTRIPSSGTRFTFQDYVLCGPEPPSENELSTNEQVATKVQQVQGAIGYVDLGTAVQFHLITIAINGQSPLPEEVEQNAYSFWNIEHMYTKGLPEAGSLISAFIQYMTNTPAEELLAQAHSYVNINTMLNIGLSSHQSCR